MAIGGGLYTYWVDVLQPYTKSWQLNACPSEKALVLPSDSVNAGKTNGYAANISLCPGGSAGLDDAKMTKPAETIAFADGVGGGGLLAYNNSGAAGNVKTDRHSDGANYGYGDGHVKWLNKTSVTGPLVSTYQ
jgi:prepilin-type processing-associated H-X9-DG protein